MAVNKTRLMAGLAFTLIFLGGAVCAQEYTYKEKQRCVDLEAQDSQKIGSAGTPDPLLARAMQAIGLMNGPSWRQEDGWIVGHIWSAPLPARRECYYETDYTERERTTTTPPPGFR